MIELLNLNVNQSDSKAHVEVLLEFRVVDDFFKPRLLQTVNSETIQLHGFRSVEEREAYFNSFPDFNLGCTRELPDGNFGFTEEYDALVKELYDKYRVTIVVDREYVDGLHGFLTYNPESDVFTFDEDWVLNEASTGIISELRKEKEPGPFLRLLDCLAKLS